MNKTTRHIVLAAFDGCQMLDIAGPMQMFASANDELGYPAYGLILAARQRGPFRTSSGLSLMAESTFAEVESAGLGPLDTVMAIGGEPGLQAALESGEICALLRLAAERGARLASVCTGTFFLSAAGLLDGRRAATHWRAVDHLRRANPAIEVDPDAIYVRDGSIWSSAGVTAGIDLALALIEADHDRALALAIARTHVVFRVRPGGQSQFSSDLAAQSTEDGRLQRLADKIAGQPDRDWNTDVLAGEIGVSVRTLSRLFRKQLNASPAEFVERIRIEQARQALLESEARIETVAHACGFGSLRRMDRAFSRIVSATPSEFRNRFKPKGISS